MSIVLVGFLEQSSTKPQFYHAVTKRELIALAFGVRLEEQKKTNARLWTENGGPLVPIYKLFFIHEIQVFLATT